MKITTITEDNIDEFVNNMQNNKKTFIAFLAPWCGHCHAFKYEWENIKKQLKDKKTLVGEIVTMNDKMAGKLPPHVKKPTAFPTFSLYDGIRHIDDYTGERNSTDMIAFIKKNMSATNNKTRRRRNTRARRRRNTRAHRRINTRARRRRRGY